jgi:hypothetical protein
MMLNISQRAGRVVARTFSIKQAFQNKAPIRRAKADGGKSDNPQHYLKIKYLGHTTVPVGASRLAEAVWE